MPDQLKQITCMKLSPNKRWLVLAEQRKSDSSCYLSIYDLKEPCYVVHKVHNITEMCEGRGNVYSAGQSMNNQATNGSATMSAGTGAAAAGNGVAATAGSATPGMASANTTGSINRN